MINPVQYIRNSFYSTALTVIAGVGAMTMLSGCGGDEPEDQVTPKIENLTGTVDGFTIATRSNLVVDAGMKVRGDVNDMTYAISVGAANSDGSNSNGTMTFSKVNIIKDNSTLALYSEGHVVGADNIEAVDVTITFNEKAKAEHTQGLKTIHFRANQEAVAGLYPQERPDLAQFLKDNPEAFKEAMNNALSSFNDDPKKAGTDPMPVFVNVSAPR